MEFPLFLIPILVGLVAQSLKPLFNRSWYAKLEDSGGKTLPRYGGMPSAHTAFAFSLATVVAMAEGFSGVPFVIASVILIIILDDALRMRIFLGRYGAALRRLIVKLPEREQAHYPYLEERLGHKMPEVIAGGLVGIGLTSLIMWLMVVW